MTRGTIDRQLAFLAWFAAAMAGAMVVGFILTHSSQNFFQEAHAPDSYAQYLQSSPHAALGIRLNLGFDNLFLIAYGAFFVLLTVRFKELLDAPVRIVALGAMILTVLMDSMENHHIMVMLHSVENGLPVTAQEGQLQMALSQIKFHASHLSVLLFSFGFWKLGRLGKIAAMMLCAYIPLGVLISVVPVESAQPLELARTAFFILAFIIAARLFGKES